MSDYSALRLTPLSATLAIENALVCRFNALFCKLYRRFNVSARKSPRYCYFSLEKFYKSGGFASAIIEAVASQNCACAHLWKIKDGILQRFAEKLSFLFFEKKFWSPTHIKSLRKSYNHFVPLYIALFAIYSDKLSKYFYNIIIKKEQNFTYLTCIICFLKKMRSFLM